jgi:heme exporter protein D
VTHLPYIAAAYALALGIPVFLTASVTMRLRSARRRLAAIDPRTERTGR